MRADGLDSLAAALVEARAADRTCVIAIETDPALATNAGGAWWDVPVAAVSDHEPVREAHRRYRETRDG